MNAPFPAIEAIAPVFRRVCPRCFGIGRAGQDDANGIYRSDGYCFRCGGSGTVEYTEQPKEVTT